jgi:hypothetical protein
MQRKVHLEMMKLLREHLMDDEEEFVQEDFVLMILDDHLKMIQELSDENNVQMELSMDEDLLNIKKKSSN